MIQGEKDDWSWFWNMLPSASPPNKIHLGIAQMRVQHGPTTVFSALPQPNTEHPRIEPIQTTTGSCGGPHLGPQDKCNDEVAAANRRRPSFWEQNLRSTHACNVFVGAANTPKNGYFGKSLQQGISFSLEEEWVGCCPKLVSLSLLAIIKSLLLLLWCYAFCNSKDWGILLKSSDPPQGS